MEKKKIGDMRIRSTTILAVRRDGQVAIGGDGQVTLGDTAIKHGARKIRRIHNDKVLIGFAGSASDAITLYENLEKKWSSIAETFRNQQWNSHVSGAVIECFAK